MVRSRQKRPLKFCKLSLACSRPSSPAHKSRILPVCLLASLSPLSGWLSFYCPFGQIIIYFDNFSAHCHPEQTVQRERPAEQSIETCVKAVKEKETGKQNTYTRLLYSQLARHQSKGAVLFFVHTDCTSSSSSNIRRSHCGSHWPAKSQCTWEQSLKCHLQFAASQFTLALSFFPFHYMAHCRNTKRHLI